MCHYHFFNKNQAFLTIPIPRIIKLSDRSECHNYYYEASNKDDLYESSMF